ncbi:predicted protein [Verticillium alfalfae VaMs.102]|uniref:Predicted protein n=1 Tax=Verticillium alfalfae (strain VaMs.102 / ATCC MYA-4576 / FGSC 10136) TaxID=526221 RepID=C9SK43_VERA1|nr:predicted protein [Verticillium alfalfae VaMs.102]EEY19061.1 predicted protein [Verticillium alfalfae VaMs.102]
MIPEPETGQLLTDAGVCSIHANNRADNCDTVNNGPDNSTHIELKDPAININMMVVNINRIASESTDSRVPTDGHQSAPGRPLNADRPTSRRGAANQRQQENTKKMVWCPLCKYVVDGLKKRAACYLLFRFQTSIRAALRILTRNYPPFQVARFTGLDSSLHGDSGTGDRPTDQLIGDPILSTRREEQLKGGEREAEHGAGDGELGSFILYDGASQALGQGE